MFEGLMKKNKGINKDEIAELLKVNPDALESFEKAYKSTSLEETDDNFFNVNSKQASAKRKQTSYENKDYDVSKLDKLKDRIIHELMLHEIIVNDLDEQAGLNAVERKFLDLVEREELLEVPEEIRPQLTSRFYQIDIGKPSYQVLLEQYSKWKQTNNQRFYHMFRQGLDILDLDAITYEIIGMNPNSMGHWLPQVEKAIEKTDFFKSPKTKVVKVPLPILQLTRLPYESLTPSTIDIVNRFCMEAFELDVNKKYFIKTGTYSSKFDFRNALVQGEQEVRELGEYLLYIHFQALQMASPLSSPTIYGVSTTNEWVVREFVDDTENNPKIYKGMPLHTEYRVFVDFDENEILGVSPYWREDVMKQSFTSGEQTNHKKHDYIVYKSHEDVLYERYYANKDEVLKNIEKMLPHMNLAGQWSIDVMQNGKDFYVIDMALAAQSALSDVVEDKLKKIEEKWIPKLEENTHNAK